MKIIVEKVISDNRGISVQFSTDYGSATALWEGDLPISNRDYHVEIDIKDTLTWNRDILENDTGRYSIQMQDSVVLFTGKLDSVENDGYAVLRMGGSIIPFVTKGAPDRKSTRLNSSH